MEHQIKLDDFKDCIFESLIASEASKRGVKRLINGKRFEESQERVLESS